MAWRGVLGLRLLGNASRCVARGSRNPELMSVAGSAPPSRHIAVSSPLLVKEIIIDAADKQTTVEGVYKPSDRTDLLVKTEHTECGSCPLCALQLNLKHTDVLVLSQFLRSDGCMLPKRITGLCNPQQKKVTFLVAMAQKAGLMPNLAPSGSKKDPKKRFGSKKLNRYFDEKTLKIRI
ncbi:large ribosomal subunit protein mL66-like [Penaeus indicus]|uniref:large ribosomal subunit protein mL66-like n=1 Tax=Penaeus indicus TaxID=29960 RepID=UPI00300CA4A5